MTNFTQFAYEFDGKKGTICFENGLPLEAAKEMLFQCQKQLGHIEDTIKAQQEAAKEEAEKSFPEADALVENVA